MFVTQKMILLDILVLEKDVEAVSQLIVESGYFEPSLNTLFALDKENRWSTENVADKKKMLLNLSKHVEDLQEFFKKYEENPEIVSDYDEHTMLPKIIESIRQFEIRKNHFQDKYKHIRKKKATIAIKMAGLKMHAESQESMKKIMKKSDYFYSILGLINTSLLPLLQNEFERFKGEILTEGYVDDSEIVFITVSKDHIDELKEILNKFYFIDYGLPLEFFGEGAKNIFDLSLDYMLLCDQESVIESDMKKISSKILSDLYHIAQILQLYLKMTEIRQCVKHAGHFVLLSGWVLIDKFRDFKKKIIHICGNKFELIPTSTDEFQMKVDVPTRLSNPSILKPFEYLVTIFGMPNYKELDPTPFFAILYIFMYGAMFGDVGQGGLLFLFGIIGLLYKKKSSYAMIFGLMIWVGLSSILFGFLYGSYFGYESINYSWVPEPLWISPIYNINTMLELTFLFGVGVISFSFILGIINGIRMKDWQSLIFSHKGILAFTIYALVLTMFYFLIKKIPIPIYAYIILSVLILFLGLERVWDALFYGYGSVRDWWMGFFDIFEFFLSIITNTLSFVRIGAFALTHAALMMAIFTLRDLAGGNTFGAYIIVIIGNIFVIGMEGFIVGIQTLRLEYYEFFMRFFRGTGRKFQPVFYQKKKEKE